MAIRVFSHFGRIIVILVVLFDVTIIQRVGGYTFKKPELNRQKRQSFDDTERDGPVPSCINSTFCVDTPYYPSDLVDVLLRENGDLKYLATVDEPLEPYRQDYTPDGEALCSSQEMVVTPKTALNIDGLWLYVVNYRDYVQAVRVELCTTENRPCRFIDGFADGWKSVCKQTYIYRQMVAVTRDGRIAPQMFKLPASCKCYVKYTGDPYGRFGVGMDRRKRIKEAYKG